MIGTRLSELRKNQAMSQEELAEKLSLSRFTISSYENGNSEPSDDVIVNICKVFNVSADYLLGLIDSPLPYCRNEKAIVLPAGIPNDIIRDIREYIVFRIHKHNT